MKYSLNTSYQHPPIYIQLLIKQTSYISFSICLFLQVGSTPAWAKKEIRKIDRTYTAPQPSLSEHNGQHQKNLNSFTKALEAEFLSARGRENQSQSVYKQLALSSTDPAIIERALELSIRNQDYEQALDIAKYWHGLDESNIPSLFYLAHLSLQTHHYIEAASALDKILTFDPSASLDKVLIGIYPDNSADRDSLLTALGSLDIHRNPALLVMYAGLLVQDGQLDQALAETEKALTLKPLSTSFITLKLDILFAQERTEEALKFLDKAIRKNSKDYELRVYEIKSLIRLKKMEEALTRLEQLGKKFDLDADTLLLAALLNIDAGHYQQAQAYLVQLLTFDDYVDKAYYYLSVNAERLNEIDNALIYLSKINSSELFLKAQKRLVALRIANDQPNEAIASLTQVRAEHPEFSAELYALQTQVLQDMNQTDKARLVVNEALASNPDNQQLLAQKLKLLKPREYEEQIKTIEKLLNYDPYQPDLLTTYGISLFKNTFRINEAKQAIERSLSVRPDDLTTLRTYAEILMQQRKWKEAADPLTKLYAMTKEYNDGRLLYQVLKNSHSNKEAEKVLGSLLQLQDKKTKARSEQTSPQD